MSIPTRPGPPFGYPPPPPKKRRTGLIVALVAVVLVAACCIGGLVFMATGNDKVHVSQSPGAADPGTPRAKQGQTARDGQLEFVITGVTYGKTTLGDKYNQRNAQGQFVLVSVTVKNVGTDARDWYGGSQRAYGPNGEKYEHDGQSEYAANSGDQNFLGPVNPGNSVKGTVVFDIPKDAKLTSVELHDSLFSSGVVVDLPTR